MNRQEIDIYVVTKEGYYFWHPQKNTLMKLGKEDISKMTGSQDFVPTAGLNLVMVYNKSRVKEATERQLNFAFCDAGYISQNIYLFCASAGLNTVARGGGFDESLPKYLQLTEKQEIILLQTIGFPKEKESIKKTK
ncbi:MAG: nitroreductase family protein, partial [Bacteroidales bacterium]|nr:nitroreductase family protein [Bacteroidales bacterium]